ncbi:MAG: flagellar biosynthesis protein FlhG [Polaribacter sp.]|jgi:flagellar biosynthesis protein FlhG
MDRYATIFSISSGKGGVGKTQVCANLAVSLAEMGQKVCIVDADHGLANINIVLGIPANQSQSAFAKEEIQNQLYQNANPLPFVIKTNLGVDLLPSISGLNVHSDNRLSPNESQIEQMLEKLRVHYDAILIDTPAGIGANVKNYIAISDHTLVIVNTKPTSLTDSFALIRTMQYVTNSFEVIINRVPSAAAATKVYKRFDGAVKKYIGGELSALGYIREDTLVSAALLSQRVLLKYSPNCLASQCINRLSIKLIEKIKSTPRKPKKTVIKKTNIPNATEVISLNEVSFKGEPQIIFDNWLEQIGQLINSDDLNSYEKNYRVKHFISQLELICEKDQYFLNALESLVVGIGETSKPSPKKNIHTKYNLSRYNISNNLILS